MISHLSADELASYRAGLFSDGKAARISAHLSGCAQCAAVDTGLASVSSLLASIPMPPMPDQLTERLQAAISVEAARRASGPAISPARQAEVAPAGAPARIGVPGRLDLPERSSRRRLRPRMPDWSSPLLLRGLAATGALALVVSVGFVLATSHDSTTAGTTASGAGGARRPEARPAVNQGENAGAVRPVSVPYRENGAYVSTNAVASGARYTSANLAGGIRKVLTSSPELDFGPPGVSSEPVPSATGLSHAGPKTIGHFSIHQLGMCLAAIAGGQPVLLADVAHYRGSPAVIVILKPVHHTYDVVVASLGAEPAAATSSRG